MPAQEAPNRCCDYAHHGPFHINTDIGSILASRINESLIRCLVPRLAVRFSPYNYSLNLRYLMLGIVSSFIGQHGIAYVLEKYKKQSVIIFLIALILLISDVGLGVDGTISIIADAEVSSAVHHRLQHRK